MKIINIALILLLSLVGGCELTGGDDQVKGDGSNTTVSGEVEGRAVKGVLGQALVQAYAVENGGLRWLTETVTDADGYYSLALKGIRGPVLLEVTAAPGATMRCDGISGCGTAAFGELTNLAEDFRLATLLLPGEIDNDQVAITPLTHLAAEWAREVEAVPGEDVVNLSRSRVAGILSVTPSFAFRNLPDITNPQELEGSDASSVGAAVMAAAFQEGAARWGEGFLEDMSQRFKAHRGELNRTGQGASLQSLLDAAVAVARGTAGSEALSAIAASLEYQRDHMEPGITMVQSPLLDDESRAFVNARGAIVGMAKGMARFGINREGDFAATRHQEMAWVMQPGTQAVYQDLSGIVGTAAVVSLLGDLAPGPGTLQLQSGMSFTRNYLENRGVLTVSIDEPGRMVEMRVELPLARQVLAESQVLQAHTEGRIANGDMVMELDNDVAIDLMQTNIMPLIIALDTMMIAGGSLAWEDLARELEEYTESLHSRIDIDGDMRLSNTRLMRDAFIFANTSIEVDRRNLDGRADALEVSVGEFMLEDAFGRVVRNAEGENALQLTIDEDLSLSSAITLNDKGTPTLGATYNMSLPGAGTRLNESGAGAVFPADGAEASLELDFPQLSSRYRLSQADGRVTVSRSHSSETAFEVRNLQPGGGLLYAGDEMIGTVVLDPENFSACFLLMDGGDHCMDMGSAEEMVSLPERKLVSALTQ